MIALRGLESSLREGAEAPIRWAEQSGLRVKITSVRRSQEEQRRLRNNYEKCVSYGLFPSPVSLGRGLSCKWPAAPAGQSGHQYGLAWDSTITDPARRWPQSDINDWWVRVREYFGWYVPAGDAIHAELPDWRELLA